MEDVKEEQLRDDMVEGLTLTGDILKTFEDKNVVIKTFKKETKVYDGIERKKTILGVQVHDGCTMDWQLNTGNIRELVKKYGAMMEDWINKGVELETKVKEIQGIDRDVIYVVKED